MRLINFGIFGKIGGLTGELSGTTYGARGINEDF